MSGIVIVHDFLGQFGGAERVVEEMCEVYPQAPVYTSYYAPDRTFDYFRSREVRTSFLDRAPGIHDHYKAYLALYPLAFSRLSLPECGLVLSSSSSFAKGVRIPSGARHVCYCHAPMRFAWDLERYVAHDSDLSLASKTGARAIAGRLRRLDLRANETVDLFVANSENIRDRISRYYGRDSVVVHPPVEVDRFRRSPETDDYYLVLSRLVGYKRIDLAIDACSRTGRRLVVVGEGPERAGLQARAGATVEFRGRVSDEETCRALARCRALLFCGDEDFGITPVEAMASGRPVVAFGSGGALETVVDGRTGVFFAEQTPESVIDALERFETMTFEPEECVAHARGFRPEVFRQGLLDAVGSVMPAPAGASKAPSGRREAEAS